MYKVITTETNGTVCMKRAICANLYQESMSVATKENFDLKDQLKDQLTPSLNRIFLSTISESLGGNTGKKVINLVR